MRHVANFLDPYCEARLMEEIVKEGKGDIEIREDENDHSPIVFSKKLNRGISLESLCAVFPYDCIAEKVVETFEAAITAEAALDDMDNVLDDLKGISNDSKLYS